MFQSNTLKIFLFDIDSTLMNSAGSGRIAMNNAFEKVSGIENILDGISLHGSTDSGIFSGIKKKYPDIFKNQDIFLKVKQVYFEELRVSLAENTRKQILPGVEELLVMLVAQGFKIGVVTGNFKESALLKLKSVGLEKYFSFGGYAFEHADRAVILKSALENFSFPYKSVLVGDTPFDAGAALKNNINAVGVLTGIFSASDMLKAGCSIVLKDLTFMNEDIVNALFA